MDKLASYDSLLRVAASQDLPIPSLKRRFRTSLDVSRYFLPNTELMFYRAFLGALIRR